MLEFLRNRDDVEKISVPGGVVICEFGETCENLIVLIKGRVKILRCGVDGRRLTLYQVFPGESCVLTASCLLNNKVFPAIAVTDVDSEGYVISKTLLRKWLKTEPEWQAFIFNLLAQRMGDLIEKVDQLAFETLESRLLQWLTQYSPRSKIKITHQELAEELASSREVVSRLLKKMEQDGVVKLHRGFIHRI